MIKDFLKRNKSIFFMGLLIGTIFLIIIITSFFRPKTSPGLHKIYEEEPLYTVIENSEDISDPENTSENIIEETKESTEAYKSFDEKYGIVEITYKENGFIPKNYRAYKGQLVRWTNTTENPIYLEQKMKYYSELEEPVKIDPGGTFELRMEKEKLWTFQEKETKSFGSVFVILAEE